MSLVRGGEVLEISAELDGASLRLADGTSVTIRRDGDAVVVERGSHGRRLHVALRGRNALVFENGRSATFARLDPLDRADNRASGGDAILAPMPGLVTKLLVGPGEAVVASADDVDAALSEALTRLAPGPAAAEVARQTGANRKALYARALEMKAGR